MVKFFINDDPDKPELPIHSNCKCRFVAVSQNDFIKQQMFEFGKMTHEQWELQENDDKNLWCNTFRKRFGKHIDKYSWQYNVP